MNKIEILVGLPASGKSTYAKQLVAKDPDHWVRINNDDLRAMMNGSMYSSEYEKMVTNIRHFLIREALKNHKNVILDNLNLNKKHFTSACSIAKASNRDVQVYEKTFYIELEEAIERDSKREGKAQVGEQVIRKWWKESGGKQFKFYNPKTEIFYADKRQVQNQEWISGLPEAVICDLDGTLAIIHDRDPYNATDCDLKDLPNIPVIETVLAHYRLGRKIIFCSGREDKYRPETIRFIEKYVRLNNEPIQYSLLMRKTGDSRKDAIVKEELYEASIHNQFNVLFVLDDRNQVVEFWREKGLTCFQVAEGDF